jgi:nucleotide-binding universal stress UspA family protein
MPSRDTHLGIVVGMDDSPAAAAAVEWAAHEAELRRIPLTLVHAISPNLTSWRDNPLPPGLAQWQKEHGRRLLEGAAKIIEKTCQHSGTTEIHSQVMSSAAVPTMIELSKNAEMIVTGCYGDGRSSSRRLGSVTSGLLRHASCPVAIIHTGAAVAPRGDGMPVVVGIDGSPASESAAAIAFEEASRRRVGLVVVHAWSDLDVSKWPDLDWPAAQSMSEQMLDDGLVRWQEQYPEVSVRRIIARDQPTHQLITHSADAQLLVVGSRGRGGFDEMLVGSVSEAVALLAKTPVIVTRQSRT